MEKFKVIYLSYSNVLTSSIDLFSSKEEAYEEVSRAYKHDADVDQCWVEKASDTDLVEEELYSAVKQFKEGVLTGEEASAILEKNGGKLYLYEDHVVWKSTTGLHYMNF